MLEENRCINQSTLPEEVPLRPEEIEPFLATEILPTVYQIENLNNLLDNLLADLRPLNHFFVETSNVAYSSTD